MSYQTDLHFVVNVTKRKNYSEMQNRQPHSYPEFIQNMRELVGLRQDLKHYITTQIGASSKILASFNTYLMALDCDSDDGLSLATQCLQRANIGYYVIISSYTNSSSGNRYWVICDKKGTASEIADCILAVPGVDPNFAACCKEYQLINLRAHPKNFVLPIFSACGMSGLICCKTDFSNEFKEWLNNFRAYWESDDVKDVFRQLVFLNRKESHIHSVGSHLPYHLLRGMREMFPSSQQLNTQVKNCLYGIEVGDD